MAVWPHNEPSLNILVRFLSILGSKIFTSSLWLISAIVVILLCAFEWLQMVMRLFLSVCHGDAASCVAAAAAASQRPAACRMPSPASPASCFSAFLVLTIFSLQLRLRFLLLRFVSSRFVCFALLCFCSAFVVLFARLSAHVTWQFVCSSHIWQNVAVCLSLSPTVCLSVRVCVCV